MPIKLPEPSYTCKGHHDPRFDTNLYSEAKLKQAIKDALEEAALLCDAYSIDRRALYKGRPPYKGNEPGRADQYIDGQSGGADDCAVEIRKLKDQL